MPTPFSEIHHSILPKFWYDRALKKVWNNTSIAFLHARNHQFTDFLSNKNFIKYIFLFW